MKSPTGWHETKKPWAAPSSNVGLYLELYAGQDLKYTPKRYRMLYALKDAKKPVLEKELYRTSHTSDNGNDTPRLLGGTGYITRYQRDADNLFGYTLLPKGRAWLKRNQVQGEKDRITFEAPSVYLPPPNAVSTVSWAKALARARKKAFSAKGPVSDEVIRGWRAYTLQDTAPILNGLANRTWTSGTLIAVCSRPDLYHGVEADDGCANEAERAVIHQYLDSGFNCSCGIYITTNRNLLRRYIHDQAMYTVIAQVVASGAVAPFQHGYKATEVTIEKLLVHPYISDEVRAKLAERYTCEVEAKGWSWS